MQNPDNWLIEVRREWDGWRTAQVRLGDLKEVQWHQPKRAPRPLIHGYVSCASLLDDGLPHECADSTAPHRLLVCVLKAHTAEAVYLELTRRAGGGTGESDAAPPRLGRRAPTARQPRERFPLR